MATGSTSTPTLPNGVQCDPNSLSGADALYCLVQSPFASEVGSRRRQFVLWNAHRHLSSMRTRFGLRWATPLGQWRL